MVLVEGAVSSEEDLEKIHTIRERTKTVVSLGDCAVTANVPGMRNRFSLEAGLHRAYFENAQLNQQVPRRGHSAIAANFAAGSRVRQGRRFRPWMSAFGRDDLFCLDRASGRTNA